MIYCVDDDSTIREIEVYALNQTGFLAKGFEDGDSMWKAIEQELPELIILDIMLPGKDGVVLLKELRKNAKTCKIPVIMATAKGTEMDKIRGLDSGADDYLVKPFGVMEMVSRVKAVLRRYRPEEEKELRFKSIRLNEKAHHVYVGEEQLILTNKEFELLKLFMKNPETVFTREQLLSKIWGQDFLGESRTVDMHIKNLRQKLGEEGKCIGTVIGVGYRLEARRR